MTQAVSAAGGSRRKRRKRVRVVQDQGNPAATGDKGSYDDQEAADQQDASMSPELGRAGGRQLSHVLTDFKQEDPQELYNASVQESNTYGHDYGQNSAISEDDHGTALQQSAENRDLDGESESYRPENFELSLVDWSTLVLTTAHAAVSTESPQLASEQSAQANTYIPQVDATGSQQEEHSLTKPNNDIVGITEISA